MVKQHLIEVFNDVHIFGFFLLTHFTLVMMNSVLDFINFVSGNGLSDYPKSLPEPVFLWVHSMIYMLP